MRIVVLYEDGSSWVSWAAAGETPAQAFTRGIRKALAARPGETHAGAWLYMED